MKRLVSFVLLAALLAGCGAQQTFETVADEYLLPVANTRREVSLVLPEEANVQAMQDTEGGTLYLCDAYTLTVQTVESGSLSRTLLGATGFSEDDLQVMSSRQGDNKRYEAVWTAAGEGEPQIGRVCILDDGSYHYVLTAMTSASVAGQNQKALQEIFSSFDLVNIAP
jgi:hypothetical protein